MKTRLFIILLIICAGVFFLSTSKVLLNAQQAADQSKQATGSVGASKEQMEDPDSRMMRADFYLERFAAVEAVERLMKDNLEQIYLLKVIVANFPEASWKEDYNKLYETYKNGLQNYYRRKVIGAQKDLEKNRKEISELFQKATVKYKKDTDEMLDVCAKSVLIVSLNKLTRYDPDKNKQLMDNVMRLRVAYGQTDDAYEAGVNHKHMYAVYHFRVAKTYAIAIMDDLINETMIRKDFAEADEQKAIQELVSKKNSFDLPTHRADNLNKIKSQQQAQAK